GAAGTNEGAIFEFSLLDHSIRQRSFPAPGETVCCPVYDPSGARLAFNRNEMETVVIGRGREAVRALPASWAGPTWTADGRALVSSWDGRLAEVDPVSGSVTEPAAATAAGRDISDITIRGTRMAFVRWTLEHSIWQLTLRRTGDARTPKISAEPAVQLI